MALLTFIHGGAGAVVSTKALEGANLFCARLSHTSVLGYQPTGLVFGRNLMGRRVKLVPTMGVMHNGV